MTRNVTKDHVNEIFSHYGKFEIKNHLIIILLGMALQLLLNLISGSIKFIEFPADRFHKLGRGFAYVEYTNAEDAENAMKHMDGGQIDGQEVTVAPILLPRPRPPMRRGGMSPMRRGGRWRSPQRFRRRSPIRRRSPPRRRSRSPIRNRRRKSNSSGSSR